MPLDVAVRPLDAPAVIPLVEDHPAAGGLLDAADSVLRRLGLDAAALAALQSQGFVSCEQRRPHHAPIYKLRYRVNGKQRIRYLGSEPGLIAAVRQELATLQEGVKRDRQTQRLLQQARSGLRIARAQLTPWLQGEGYHFHGMTIRRSRCPPAEARRFDKLTGCIAPGAAEG